MPEFPPRVSTKRKAEFAARFLAPLVIFRVKVYRGTFLMKGSAKALATGVFKVSNE